MLGGSPSSSRHNLSVDAHPHATTGGRPSIRSWFRLARSRAGHSNDSPSRGPIRHRRHFSTTAYRGDARSPSTAGAGEGTTRAAVPVRPPTPARAERVVLYRTFAMPAHSDWYATGAQRDTLDGRPSIHRGAAVRRGMWPAQRATLHIPSHRSRLADRELVFR